MTHAVRTRVAIVGAGPAGLLLSHLLHRSGVESIVIDSRSRADIEQTVRAGILEQGSVEVLAASQASDRVLSAPRHQGIELRFDGVGHRIDFAALVGRSVWLYPQHEVLIDLIARRTADGADVRFGTAALGVTGAASRRPTLRVSGPDGEYDIEADIVVGADGSHSAVRPAVVDPDNRGYFREYPFAWFGILCEAPPSAPELIYSTSARGFALISQRSETVQRMYLQCDPDFDPASMSEPQIWDELEARVGSSLNRGPIFKRDVLRFRSFVAQRVRSGRVFLVGDAAHTVPPTGAKGMNLAIADVVVLHHAIAEFARTGSEALFDSYSDTVLKRVWKAQHFSWWMTSMLHAAPDASDFDQRRRIAELASVTESRAGSTFLAEAYTGWPLAQ